MKGKQVTSLFAEYPF